MAKAETPQPKRPAAPRPRVRRFPPARPAPSHHTPPLPVPPGDETLRRWFEDEVDTLQRLAHTQRLKGDYVAAQTLEAEIRALASETAALLQARMYGEPRG